MAQFDFGNLADELKDMGDECGVSLEDKQLSWDTAEDVKDVITAIENMKVVNFLKLDGNTLGVDAAAAIGKALERHPEFRKALWSNMFTGRLKTEIPLALKYLGNGLIVAKAHLTVLDLSHNALGPNGMRGLKGLLRSEVCYSLHELRLNNCGLGIGGGQILSDALLYSHKSSTDAGTPLQLKIFVAGYNRLENDGAKVLAKTFSTLKTLEEISMPQNSIYHAGIAALATALKQNPYLRVLNLNDNNLNEKASAAIAEVFAFTPNLQNINFGDCLIKNGVHFFAEALEPKHLQLEIVDFSYNEIDASDAMKLVQAIQNKPNLKRLNLDGNQFDNEAIKNAMIGSYNPDALVDENDSDAGKIEGIVCDDGHQNDPTKETDECDDFRRLRNEIDASGDMELVQAIQNKPDLKRLNLDGNQFGYKGNEAIKDAIIGSYNPEALVDDGDSMWNKFDENNGEEEDAGKKEGDLTEETDEDDDCCSIFRRLFERVHFLLYPIPQ